VAEPGGGEPGREHYRFSRPVDWEVEATGRLITLRGMDNGEQSRQPRLVVEVVAAPGGVP
jgi:hypothetical protein